MTKVNIGGIEVEVIDHVPEGTIVACMRLASLEKPYFDNDVHADCPECGEKIVYRPYWPETTVKMCIECVLDRAKGGTA